MERRNLVYGIVDTREPDRIRYVGLTTCGLETRMRNHWAYARRSENPSKIQAWLKSRLNQPEVVQIKELFEAESLEALKEAEVKHIAHYRALNQADLNLTDGGDGNLGVLRTEESKTRMSEKYRQTGGPSAKLNWEQVREIRERRVAEYSKAEILASEYGVARTAIDRILKNQLWFDPAFDPSTLAPRAPGSISTAKLTMDQVNEMRDLRKAQWVSSRSLAQKYGVKEATIQFILNNKSYHDESYDPRDLCKRAPGQFNPGVIGKGHLSNEQRQEATTRLSNGESVGVIAREYGITESHAYYLRRSGSGVRQ